jgi:hypothetical protein
MPKTVILLGLIVFATAAPLALESVDSDPTWVFFVIFIVSPIILVLGFFAGSRVVGAIRSGAMTLRTLVLFFVIVAFASLAVYGGVWRWLHVPNIHYEFSYGESDSWHEVQFTHTEHGREIEGPWVGGYPMRVQFPDINHDGYPDIRVTGNGSKIVEYVYLPHNDGKCFWHLVRAEGFGVSYTPDEQSSRN